MEATDTRQWLLDQIARSIRVRKANLRDAALDGVDLSGLRADDCAMQGADLRCALLRGARLGMCRMDGARLENADLGAATLRRCTLDRAQAAGASFSGATFEDSSAVGADLGGADFSGTQLSETAFTRALLADAVFESAEGDGVGFRGADLQRARFGGARFADADFRGADLTGADLSQARLPGADFRGAVLAGTRLNGADVAGALFDVDAAYPASGDQAAESAAAAGDTLGAADITDELREALDQLEALVASGPGSAMPLFAGARRALATLREEAGADRPPAAWQPALAPLIEMMDGRRALEPAAFEAALRAIATGPAPAPTEESP